MQKKISSNFFIEPLKLFASTIQRFKKYIFDPCICNDLALCTICYLPKSSAPLLPLHIKCSSSTSAFILSAYSLLESNHFLPGYKQKSHLNSPKPKLEIKIVLIFYKTPLVWPYSNNITLYPCSNMYFTMQNNTKWYVLTRGSWNSLEILELIKLSGSIQCFFPIWLLQWEFLL